MNKKMSARNYNRKIQAAKNWMTGLKRVSKREQLLTKKIEAGYGEDYYAAGFGKR